MELNKKVEAKVTTQNKNQKEKDNKEIETLKNENKKLREEKDSLNKENQKLREENDNLKKKLADLILTKDQEIKKIEEKYIKLIEGKTVDDLKSKLRSNDVDSKNYNNLLNGEKLVALNFISVDQRINHTIICKNITKFHDVEGQLYEKFPQYEDGENFFLFNGNRINRWRSLEDNGIPGYTIMLQKIEN